MATLATVTQATWPWPPSALGESPPGTAVCRLPIYKVRPAEARMKKVASPCECEDALLDLGQIWVGVVENLSGARSLEPNNLRFVSQPHCLLAAGASSSVKWG